MVLELNDRRIAIFKYEQYSKSYKRNQDSFTGDHGSVSFDKDHLVYSAECGFSVYHQQDITQAYHQPYVLQQQVNFTDWCVSSASISHDRDLLVVGGVNKTHIYVQDNNGSWEEQLTLDDWYQQYRVSERDILAAKYNETTKKDEVYYFNIENCANTPTQLPSSSTAPSSSIQPTQAPSIGVTRSWSSSNAGGTAKTISPTPGFYNCSSVSISQTANTPPASSPDNTCYSIDVVVVYDDKPLDSVWDIQRVTLNGDNEVLKVSRGTADDVFKLRKESLCLTAGVYQFTMHDEKQQGGGFSYPGYYNVSSSGDLIAQGRDFFCNSTSTFALPLTAAPSIMPSETVSPTFSPSYVPSEPPSASPTISPTVTLQPSLSPSVSSSPTKTCYQIDILVVFDRYPSEISWQLQKMNDSGDYILIKTFNGSSDDKYKAQTESMCLEGEREYQFAIYDTFGDGIEAPGHYKVTSDGNLIVQGGEFGHGEITSFSIPYVTGSSILTTVTHEPTNPSPTYQPQTPFPAYSLASPPTTQTPWRLTPFPTDPESTGSSPRPHNITLAPTISSPSPNSATDLSTGDTLPPVASPDSANLSTSEDSMIFVSVLENDTPTAGETLDVKSIISDASNGTCSIGFDLQEVVYEPYPGIVGVDTCVYEACDSVSACDTATLTVIVTSQTTEACGDITTKKDCTKSTSNCFWDTTVEGGPGCLSSNEA